MNEGRKARAPSRGWLLVPAIAAVFTVLYALAGFLLAPWIAERELPRFAAERLQHRARVGAISFNPFTLRLQLREFALETEEGRPVLGFAEGVADLAWHSLLRRAWVLDEVRLVGPAVRVEIAKDGRLNLAALAPETATSGSPQPVRFAVGRFSVANGSIDFEDHRQGYRNRLEHLSIELAALSTLNAEQGSYALAGQTPAGAKLRWKGEQSLAPLAATGTITVADMALAELMPYVDDFTAARIVAGRADIELPYRLALADGKLSVNLKGAKLDLRDLALAGAKEKQLLAKFGAMSFGGVDFDSAAQHASAKAIRVGASTVVSGKGRLPLASAGPIAVDGVEFELAKRHGSVRALALAGAVLAGGEDTKPLARLGQLTLDGIAFDLGSQRASVQGLRIAELMLSVERDAKGELDIMRVFTGGGASDGGKPARGAKPANWQASIGTVQIGNASARYTDRRAKAPIEVVADGLSGSFGFDAASGGEGVRVRLDAGQFALAKLDAAPEPAAGAQPPAVRLAQLSVSGARYDSGASALEIEAARLGRFGADTALENGRASLLDLLLDLLSAAEKPKSEKPLSARAKIIELGEGAVNLTDRASGLTFGLERLAGKLKDVSNDPAQPLSFDLGADVRNGGRIAARGQAMLAQGTVDAKIEARSVALAALAPARSVLARYPGMSLGSGDLTLSGSLRIGGKAAEVAYSGSAAIANLALVDAAGARLFGWNALATDTLKATRSPDRVDIDELRLTAPAGRLAIAKDGTSNISRAFAVSQPPAGGTAPPGSAESTPRAAVAESAAGSGNVAANPGGQSDFSVAVRRVRVEQGALDFSDDSLSPGFVARIYELAGTVNGLSSNHEIRSQFTFEGRVDEFGYARLSGAVNPFAPRNRSTFRVQLRNIDLTTASPYSMRFAGYRIATGRLGLDLNYRVRANVIEGDNKISLEQFTLGERVDSPQALDLPFELAVALLKDADGRISLEVPVKGDLDHPDFSLAPLVWKAVGNLVGGIVSAPFRALAHLFGGGSEEDAGVIAFDAGKSRLLPPEQEKLGRVAEALAKRPELKLLIPERYDSEADARALKRVALGREIARRAGFALGEDDDPGMVNIEDRPTRRALRTLYAERFSKAELDRLRAETEAKARAAGQAPPSVTERVRNLASGDLQVTDAREFYQTLLRRLREAQPLRPNALEELAQKRALAIEAALQAAGTDAVRMVRTRAAPTSDAEARQVLVRLSLAVS